MNISWQAELSIYRFGSKNVYGEAQLQFVRKTKVGVVKFEQSNENRPSGQIALEAAERRRWNCLTQYLLLHLKPLFNSTTFLCWRDRS